MTGFRHDECARHRPALIDFFDRQDRTATTRAALAHLERCRQCEDDLAGIIRTIASLRRLAESVPAIEPGPATWPTLRARLARPEPQPAHWRHPIGGAVAAAVVALLVIPSLGGVAVRPPTGVQETPISVAVDRHYETSGGPLTAGIVNAIAGQDVSIRARLRSAVSHIGPASVDRDEPSRTSTSLAASTDGAGMPVAITRS
jgi:hypothetical protein